MTCRDGRTETDPEPSAPRGNSELHTSDTLLAAVQDEVLEAMRIGVLACDPSYRIVVASTRARAILSRFASAASTNQIPEPIAAVLRAAARGPVRVATAGQTVQVWTRPIQIGWVSGVVWLGVEAGAGDLDLALRRRWHLTRRQLDIVHELRRGYRNQEIAAHLGLACSSVKAYLTHIFDALGVRSRGEAIALIERVRRDG